MNYMLNLQKWTSEYNQELFIFTAVTAKVQVIIKLVKKKKSW